MHSSLTHEKLIASVTVTGNIGVSCLLETTNMFLNEAISLISECRCRSFQQFQFRRS